MYDELAKRLRNCAELHGECALCLYLGNGCDAMPETPLIQAAAVIEELSSQLDDFKRLCLPLKENRLYKYSDGSFVEVFLILLPEPPKEV